MKPTTDLHCHPSVKALLGMHPTLNDRAWQDYRFNLRLLGIGNIDEHFGDALDSQSNLKQISKGKGKVIFWTIYPFEKEYVEKRELIKLATKAKGINQKMVDYFLEDKPDGRYIKRNVAYYDIVINEELPLYKATEKIKRLTRTDLTLDSSLLNVVLCIEGAHSFHSALDKPWLRGGINTTKYLRRVEHLFSNYPIRYMTMAHIAPNGIFNNAYAGKLLKNSEVLKFAPRNMGDLGITDLGFDLIQKCIDHGVHPDVKHLSYRARLSLYDILENMKADGEKIIAPIASHMGVWGIPESGIEGALTIGATFNTFVYKGLGGIIGIIMDQRVLGVGSYGKLEEDVMTFDDFKWICDRNGFSPYDYVKGNTVAEVKRRAKTLRHPKKVKWPTRSPNRLVDTTGPPKSRKANRHLKYFCCNILHTLDVLVDHGFSEPWKYVCFGSDYDGLVDAVDCCKTFADMPKFRSRVAKYMRGVNGFQARYGISPTAFTDKFFYTNALDFFGIIYE